MSEEKDQIVLKCFNLLNGGHQHGVLKDGDSLLYALELQKGTYESSSGMAAQMTGMGKEGYAAKVDEHKRKAQEVNSAMGELQALQLSDEEILAILYAEGYK